MAKVDVTALLPSALSRTEWRSLAMIMAELRKKTDTNGIDSQVFKSLQQAISEHWVEEREQAVPKTLGNPTGTRNEYRLIGVGRHTEQEPKRRLLGGLIPSIV